MRCPFYDEMDQIMQRCISTRSSLLAEGGEGSGAVDRQEGMAASESWAAPASDHWGTQASESWGCDELGYVVPEAQDQFGEVQAVRVQVKEEEASADELPPQPGKPLLLVNAHWLWGVSKTLLHFHVSAGSLCGILVCCLAEF